MPFDFSNMFSNFMPSAEGIGWGLPASMIGMGLGGDIFNAIQRQKVYNQQKAAIRAAQDPNYWKRFYQPASDAYLQNLTRDVNSSLAMRGVESGGEANMAISRAMAEQELQRQQQAMNQANSQLSSWSNTAGNMGTQYGQGGMGGLSSSLSSMPWLMMMPGMMQNNALQNQLLQRRISNDNNGMVGSGMPGFGGPGLAAYNQQTGSTPFYNRFNTSFSGGGSPSLDAPMPDADWAAGLEGY